MKRMAERRREEGDEKGKKDKEGEKRELKGAGEEERK